MDIATLVSRAATRFRDRVAVEGPDGQRTFGELGDRVTRLASGLLATGLRPGDVVLDLQTNSVAYLETDLAIRSAGLVRTALNYRLHPSDWERIAQDSDARAIIYDPRFADPTQAIRGELTSICVGAGEDIPLESIIAQGSTTTLVPQPPDALCGLHYSSGTTGHPKGAQRTHRNWFASVVNVTHDVLLGVPAADDVYVHAGPMTHTSGLFILPFLVAGAKQTIMARWSPDDFLQAVTEGGGTHTAVVPTMIARLLADGPRTDDALRSLKMLAYAGAPMPPDQIARAAAELSTNLVQYYGLVEAIPPVTVLDRAAHAAGLDGRPDLLTSAGQPALGVDIAVVDEEGLPLPAGELGEVITRGDHVMAGYRNAADRDDLSKSVIDGWLHTGDIGRMDDEGYLWLVDRRGDMIISGGYNIYPREVEDAIAQLAEVAEVAVVGVTDPDWGQRVVAFVKARRGAHIEESRVIDHCRGALAAYKKPKDVHIVDDLPLNSTGKVAKKELKRLVESGAAT